MNAGEKDDFKATRDLALTMYDKAIFEFSEAIKAINGADAVHQEQVSRCSRYYFNRGLCYTGKTNLSANPRTDRGRAIEDFTQAIRRDPEFILALYFRGDSYLLRNEYDKAIADFSKVIHIAPFPKAHYYLSRSLAYIAKGEKKKAEADSQRARQLSNKSK